MTVKQIMNSIYIIPVILDHLEHPTNTTAKILKQHKISVYKLKELEKIKSLLMYHKNTIQNNFKPNYSLLRQGLKEYWEEYLSDFFYKFGMVNESKIFLDYCCGDGQIGRKYSELNPKSSVLYVDKEPPPGSGINIIDFEQNPNWFIDEGIICCLDTVLLSEILHCKNSFWQSYLIESSFKMLVTGGRLMVIENIDYFMEYRINKIKKSDVKVVTPSILDRLTENLFKLEKRVTIQSHIAYVFTKI